MPALRAAASTRLHGSTADALARLATLDLGWRGVVHVRAMTLAGVNDQNAGLARRRQHLPARLDCGFEQTDIIAERFAEAARLQEVALHVDDDQRRSGKIDRDRSGFGGDLRVQKGPLPTGARVAPFT
jgi:hypothetical protein